MKKILFLALISISLFTSCSSDDDSVKVTEQKLAKKWFYSSYQANGQTEAYVHESCAKDYIEFFANGDYTEGYVQDCDPTLFGMSEGNYAIAGDNVTVALDLEDSYTGKVTQLTDTKLQITVTVDFDDDGDEEKVKVNFTSN